jgi:1-aminocyclopropane-1-carboxylate deaminase/D-cysteine desulfhydrase-like pyridoxal-dependent ACC family enzyme
MDINQPICSGQVTIDTVESDLVTGKNIKLDVLRLDKLHPVISGNKWFKLKYYLADAADRGYTKIVTSGGPYSNHIAATAYAAKQHNFGAAGIIRGEQPPLLNHTLSAARDLGMELCFLSRNDYNLLKRSMDSDLINERFRNHYFIPEGGFGNMGVTGAAEILQYADISKYSHIIAAVGTGTTIAGLLQAASPQQEVLGISAMKNNMSLADEISFLLNSTVPRNLRIIHDYHFGGYAKKSQPLLDFMNRFYRLSDIPLDFVYTGKVMYGIFDLISKNYFSPGAAILMIHTGGLQGNRPLPPGILEFREEM